MLYPLILEDRLELILATPNTPPIRRTVPVKKEELNAAIVQFRQVLQDPTIDAKVPAQKLYEWLIKPLEADLKQAKIDSIIYSPDGQLRYIPLASLYDGQKWLTQRYKINNITARSLTDFNRPAQSQLRVLSGAFVQGSYKFEVGGSSFSFAGLPFAGKEVDQVETLIPGGTKLVDKAFSLAAIEPKLNEYSIVHFATHGAFVPGKPQDSFLLFGNGDRPNLREIQNWSLQKVDLVVLSACETGIGGKLGNGEEILGLGYQFQRAGARATIASLWKVDDGGTQKLMSNFYAALKGKTSKSEALRAAQIALIQKGQATTGDKRASIAVVQNSNPTQTKGKLDHPYYWAPFILIGNGF
ncbi:CHAT domain-containing protein [Leptolyngbya boryana CZ1]|uniref:CHAT domain-containing protein n=1 Tax=Leptolyngbya boryana CZ1 TaxID=3060204 RepID=A0AA97ANI5_LEPBY|nr:CHAT domain-containing protein [Leptolyngbya boryana]WNZ44064.1 CHAT domain-containing protein [Leptolyngbya boryana CZ1]